MESILRKYDQQTSNHIKMCLNINRKLASLINQRIFLIKCRQENVIPTHIQNNFKCIYQLLSSEHPFMKKVTRMVEKFKHQILNTEIKITCWRLKKNENQFNYLYNKIRTNVSFTDLTFINNTINRHFQYYNHNIKIKQNNKFHRLIQKKEKLLLPSESWFVNMTNMDIPSNISNLLALGPKFSVPHRANEVPVNKIIMDVEHILTATNDSVLKNVVRTSITNNVYNHLNKSHQKNSDDMYVKDFLLTKKFLNEHKQEIMILRADKGNKTVAIPPDMYKEKMMSLLSDTNTYKVISQDPVTKVQNKNNKIIKKLYETKQIDKQMKHRLTHENAITPRIYGLIKIHKEGCPIRPIVSGTDGPTSKLAKFLCLSLSNLENESFYVKNSYEFASFITNVQLDSDDILISLDVVSLFTNIPLECITDVINKKWESIKTRTEIKKEDFLLMIDFWYNNSFFCYEGKFYHQQFGTAMGSHLSPVLANLVMDDLVEKSLAVLDFQPKFFKKYVDDIITSVPKTKVQKILEVFNNFNNNLQFTIEQEENGQLAFLDVLVFKNEQGQLHTKWYKKPTSSSRILNYNSSHPLHQRVNVAKNLVKRAINLSSACFHTEIISKIRDQLIDNGFPKQLINNIINTNASNNVTPKTKKLDQVYYTLPYIPQLSHQLKKVFNTHLNINITFKLTKTVGQLYTKTKYPVKSTQQSNVVYKISCQDCSCCYIGQTKRYLGIRLSEHKKNGEKTTNTNNCALVQHIQNSNHTFDFENAVILDKEKNLNKRLICEMLHICNNDNTVNAQTDIKNLSSVYCGLLHKQYGKILKV